MMSRCGVVEQKYLWLPEESPTHAMRSLVVPEGSPAPQGNPLTTITEADVEEAASPG